MNAQAKPPAPPLELNALLMRRAAWVGAAVMACALAVGLLAMARDMDEESRAALALAERLAAVVALAGAAQPGDSDASALQELQRLQQSLQSQPTGHLLLLLHDAQGQALLAPPPASAPPAPMRWLLQLHRQLSGEREAASVRLQLPGPAAGPWQLTLTASPEAERREALGSLLTTLGLLLLAVLGLLFALRLNLRRALAPLGDLLRVIAGIEQPEVRARQAAQALPPMPVRELEAIARALRHLCSALDATEQQRRVLGQRVITLQEDERARLGRELHDEFGQHLTALRADMSWLQRQPALQQAPSAEVLEGMQQHVRHVQQVLRGVLTRLRPLGAGGALPGTEAEREEMSLQRLAQLLQTLVDSWHLRAGSPLQVRLELSTTEGATGWPADAAQRPIAAALGLALYRITQEALTNIARHAGASQACVRLQWQPGQAIVWTVQDNGVGLPELHQALQHGSGLGGIQERVWALGADLEVAPAQPGQSLPGLRLQASLPLQQTGEPS